MKFKALQIFPLCLALCLIFTVKAEISQSTNFILNSSSVEIENDLQSENFNLSGDFSSNEVFGSSDNFVVGPEKGTYCGDGVRNGLEQCDGSDLGGQTCSSFVGSEFTLGSLSCSASCVIVTTNCQKPAGVVDDKQEQGSEQNEGLESLTLLGGGDGSFSRALIYRASNNKRVLSESSVQNTYANILYTQGRTDINLAKEKDSKLHASAEKKEIIYEDDRQGVSEKTKDIKQENFKENEKTIEVKKEGEQNKLENEIKLPIQDEEESTNIIDNKNSRNIREDVLARMLTDKNLKIKVYSGGSQNKESDFFAKISQPKDLSCKGVGNKAEKTISLVEQYKVYRGGSSNRETNFPYNKTKYQVYRGGGHNKHTANIVEDLENYKTAASKNDFTHEIINFLKFCWQILLKILI